MSTFTINFTNNTNISGDFCIFQRSPDYHLIHGLFPLAWRVQAAAPNTTVPISWNTDLFFFWAKTGPLQPGMMFHAGQAFRTDLTRGNSVTLTKRDGNYSFMNQRDWHQQGRLNVMTDATMAHHQASIGYGMSGASAFAVQAQPNMNFVFEPRAEYWVTFGNIQQGQVLDPEIITSTVKVEFPHGIFSMNVTLNPNHTWTVTQGMD